MGTRIKDFESRFNIQQPFTAVGAVGGAFYKRRGESWLRVVVEGAGISNAVQVQGKLKGQTDWQVLGTVMSVSTGTTVDVKDYDEFRFQCTAFLAGGAGVVPKLIASGFF